MGQVRAPGPGSGVGPGGVGGSARTGQVREAAGRVAREAGGLGSGSEGPGGSGARTWRSWGPGRVARTVPEGQAPGGKIAKIAKIAIFPFSCVFFSIKMAIFRKTRVLAGFFHFSGHPDRKNGVRTRIWA